MWWYRMNRKLQIPPCPPLTRGVRTATVLAPLVKGGRRAQRGGGILRGLLSAFALLSTLALTACGSHLRGEATFPFHTLYVNGGQGTPYYAELTRTLRGNKTTTLVDKAENAEAILDLSKAAGVDKQILALSGGGKVREYLLLQVIGFRVHDGKGGEWLPYGEIVIQRDF